MSAEVGTSERMRTSIRNWLLEDDYVIEDMAEDGLSWFFVAVAQDGRGFGVSQRVGKPDEVYIRQSIEIDKSLQDFLGRMKPKARNSFYSEVRFNLLFIGAEFQPEGGVIWERLTISERIFNDALTKDELIKRVFSVHKAALAFGWLINDLLSEVPSNQGAGSKISGTVH